MKSVGFSICLLFAALGAGFPAYAAGADLPAILRTQAGHLTGWVAADLDGDRQADVASAGTSRRDGHSYVQEITLRFSAFEARTITVRSSIMIERLMVRDLDGDADRDLVLESFNREPVAVLLNDADGHFHQGDLEDYRFQLSDRNPRSLESCEQESASAETGECPNDEPEFTRFSSFWPDIAARHLIAPPQVPRPVLQHCSSPSRGPPTSC